MPEGNATNYKYDSRGNVTETMLSVKPGSGNAALVSSATYPATCTNQKICNQPTTTTDQTGQVTNYEYDASSGMVSKVTAPAPASNQARPEVRTTFVNLQASVKNASNAIVLASAATRYPLTVSTCAVGSAPACVNTVNETLTAFAYELATTTRGSNLLLNTVTSRSGNSDPAQTQTINLTYDDIGNVRSQSDGVGNITQMRYNAARQPTHRWTPDPDGSGPLLPRADYIAYGPNGLPSQYTKGTINYDGSGLAGIQHHILSYDAYGRLTFDNLHQGGTNYSRTQISYDAAGRRDCVALRMNPAAYGSLPASACSHSTISANGRDRITKYQWDFAGALDRTISGYGTSVQREDARYERNNNGSVIKAIDGKGNVTSYEYDGHDRLHRTCFNVATCSFSAADKIVMIYGTTGNEKGRLIAKGTRGQLENFNTVYSYDALGRVTHINYPGTGFFDQDVSFTYDNFGRMTQALDANTHAVNYTYDALGRVTSQGDQLRKLAMQYDAAGRRTRLTWDDDGDGAADDFFVTYEYDPTGAMKAIRENGSGLLATFTYEALGRRSSLTLGNGSVTSYAYTGPNLSDFNINLGGSSISYDQNIDFQYNAAGQIRSRIGSNNNYAWTGHVNTNRGYSANALNQYTQVGSLTPVYDSKGNLGSTSTPSYGYNVNNALVTSSTGAQFYQDPLARLKIVGNGTNWTRTFEYDGPNIVTERVPSNQSIRHRYVFGPGDDEALIWYDYSSGTLVKKFLTGDERGSIVAVTGSNGAVLGVNKYDEFGIPAGGNLGMFQFTGQAWMPELGMYNYKARMYSPTLGRFMQTDPIGYGDGMNWYDYVGGDPVNRKDPTGLVEGSGWLCYGNCTGSYWNGNFGPAATESWMTPDGNGGWLLEGMITGGDKTGFTSWDFGWFRNDTNPSISETQEPQDIKKSLCEAGNSVVAGSSKVGDAALATTAVGAVAGGAGILTGNPILGGAGAGAIGAGGIMGLGAGAMQITGGVMQGLGGGGWHNALAGVVSLGTGVGISKLVQAPKGMTVHTTASWNSKGSVVGNISGALAGLDEWFKPVQVDCSK